ncbi:uncharacterized protein YjdB [Lysinibacillus parviboronicapiens]|uniref:Uncharacterized protein YjdB n=1 Tax=Lysinibacillus parviboronicapiens TaxID=436516 RepID=A0ABV2PQU6_9BACI
MNILFKKGFIYLALIMLTLVSFNVESASASEVIDFEEGVTNLNNTTENSAVIGSRLLRPEIGWKRYDDRAEKLQYTSKTEDNYSLYYKATQSYISPGAKLTFKFKGTKIRLVGAKGNASDASTSSSFIIDGKTETFDQYNVNFITQVLLYEKSGLEDTIHTVEIIPSDLKGKRIFIDAIDVDGFLIAPDDIPNAESITLDRNALELLEGSQDKLIATVTPDTAKVIWTSSDESIATVDQNGIVSAIREGQAIITATLNYHFPYGYHYLV